MYARANFTFVTKRNVFQSAHDVLIPYVLSRSTVQQDPRGATLRSAFKERLHAADRSHGGSLLNRRMPVGMLEQAGLHPPLPQVHMQ